MRVFFEEDLAIGCVLETLFECVDYLPIKSLDPSLNLLVMTHDLIALLPIYVYFLFCQCEAVPFKLLLISNRALL